MNRISKFFDDTLLDLGRQFKWSYLPPLMVYVAAGISGLTGIVGTFFVKDYLNLSAAFLAGLGFWAGIPWALKMPLGHLVDLIWNKKNYMVYFGAFLISMSLLIMYGLIIRASSTPTGISPAARCRWSPSISAARRWAASKAWPACRRRSPPGCRAMMTTTG